MSKANLFSRMRSAQQKAESRTALGEEGAKSQSLYKRAMQLQDLMKKGQLKP